MHFLKRNQNCIARRKRVPNYAKLCFFIRKQFSVFRKKIFINNKKLELYKKKSARENDSYKEKTSLQKCNKEKNELLQELEREYVKCKKGEMEEPRSVNLIEKKFVFPDQLYFNEVVKEIECKKKWEAYKDQLVIYNIFLKDNKVVNVSIEIVFQNIRLHTVDINQYLYLDVFYKQLKRDKIQNKFISIYKSKMNNIYNNLLFYYFRENINAFLLNQNLYNQFSPVLHFFFQNIFKINFLFHNSSPSWKEPRMKYYKKGPIEKCIQNYLHNLLNNSFIQSLFKRGNFISSKKTVPLLLPHKKAPAAITKNKKQKQYVDHLRKKIYVVKKINAANKWKMAAKGEERSVEVFNNFHVIHLNRLFLSTDNDIYINVLKNTTQQFISNVIEKNRQKKKQLIGNLICSYKELFHIKDIFIVDKENINKNFFFFYYHLLNGGMIFFFYNRINEQTKKRKRYAKTKDQNVAPFLQCNGIKPILKRLSCDCVRKRTLLQYFVNLNEKELRTNSTDHYIILFLYDLFFNKEFNIYNYLWPNKNPIVEDFYRRLNKKIQRRVKKNYKVVLFTNDKKLHSLCFKINIFYQNCFYKERREGEIKETAMKLVVFSEHFLKIKKDRNTPLFNKKKNNNKQWSTYDLITFSKSFQFC